MSGTKRSYDSGCIKRKKRAAEEALIASQKGALLNFVKRSSTTASRNAPSQNANDAAGIGGSSGCTTHADLSQNEALLEVESNSGNAACFGGQSKSLEAQGDIKVDEENFDLQTDHSESQQSGFLTDDKHEDMAASDSENTASEVLELSPADNQEDPDVHVIIENNDTDTSAQNISFHWKDPGLWPLSISASELVFLVEKGPFREDKQKKYPPNEHSSDGRHFSVNFFSRKLMNGETVNRTWLIYSKHKNAVFCFCCKLFSDLNIKLTSDGNNDWINMNRILKEHESSPKHMNAVTAWHELAVRLKRGETVDSEYQKLMQRECDHWNKVLQRIMSVVQFLGQRNLAFRGTSSRLRDSNNGNFLGVIELLAKYDPCLQEHLRRIKNEEIHDHYLGNHIQNELIHLVGEAILKKIIADTQVAKYYSIMLDCTPDTSHQEQMTMILRIVNTEARPVEVCEHFVGFLPVESSTGMSLTETCLKKLEELHLELQNCRGQGYDNGANMKGRNSGVQKRIIELNPKAFYVPCACHSLNLVLSDMAKSSTVAITLFGILHQIYRLFGASTQRWQMLKNHVKKFTVKPISETRWECRIDSVQAVRFQIGSIYDALVEVSESTNDPTARTEAASLAKEIKHYPFLVSLVIWHDLLAQFNLVSKMLQTKNMQFDVALQSVENIINFLKYYKDTGFEAAQDAAKGLAVELELEEEEIEFPPPQNVRRRRVCKQFVYEARDEATHDPKEKFRIGFFNVLLDQAIISMTERFKQMKSHFDYFGFLHDFQCLTHMSESDLRNRCQTVSKVLTDAVSGSDIDALDLCTELQILAHLIPPKASALRSLQFVYENNLQDSFPNVVVALRIALTIPVTVASAERSFSKLKLIKNDLRTSMTQERLNSLALISIENDVGQALDYSELIKDFARMKVRKKDFLR